ncbi:MAG TPA: tetratricopeptide repeat protein [Elusimicrobiota bacterium]|nr:tetratricopeptide repeat protein [Elusimicrobiota bacterium]
MTVRSEPPAVPPPPKNIPLKNFSGTPWLVFLLVVAVAILWTLGLYRPRSGHFPRAEAEFRPAVERERARAAAQASLEKDPENIAAWIETAVARFEEGPAQYLPALEALERARDLGAVDPRLFYYAAVMYEAVGLPDYAQPDYARYLRHRPDDAEVRLRLANLQYRLGDYDKAIEEYSRLAAARPRDAVLACNLAAAYREKQRWPEGIELLERVSRDGAPLPDGGYKIWGDLHRGAGDPRRALENYHTELTRQKDSIELAGAMAGAYEQLQDWPQAMDQWKRVAELDPKHRLAREKIRSLQRKIRAAERAGRKGK